MSLVGAQQCLAPTLFRELQEINDSIWTGYPQSDSSFPAPLLLCSSAPLRPLELDLFLFGSPLYPGTYKCKDL